MRMNLSSGRRAKIVGLIISALSVIAMATAVYLLDLHLTGALCNLGGCDIVNTSPYSEMFGIPVAAFGVAFYTVLLILGLFRLQDAFPERLPLILLLLTAWGVLYAYYLFFLEIFVIKAVCPWCFLQQILITIMFIVAVLDWRQSRSEVTG